MPIKDDLTIEYEIPNDIKSKIPDYFYHAFFGELVSVCGFGILIPRTGYETYQEQINEWIYHMEGTSAWYRAFKESCHKLDLDFLSKYRDTLEWYDCDLFDGEISEEVIKHFVNEDINCNCYYNYLYQIEQFC